MGYMGPGLPGQRSVLSAADRAFVEDQWGIPRGSLRTEVGAGAIDMFSRMAAGQIKACWIICTNPVATVANRKTVIAGLETAELVITQDAFLDTETNDYADMVLPAALWTESDGVMVNSERNLTLFQQAVDPPGQALPGLADHRPDRLRDGVFGCVQLRLRRGGVRRDQAVLRTPRPATTCAASATTGCARRRCSGPARPTAASDRNPIRYLNDGVSQTRWSARTDTCPGWPSRPRTAARCSSPARTCRRPSCPTTTTRSCSTPAGCRTSGTP